MLTHLFDSLESRRLLSVSIGPVILVRGTEGNDRIVFRVNLRTGRFRIRDNGRLSQSFSLDNAIRVEGGAGNDFISLGGITFRQDLHPTINGGAGADTLDGSNAGDRISGGAGNDLIEGLGGDDTLSGDDGHDAVHGGAGMDLLSGGNGNDSLYGEADGDTLTADGGADLLDGGDSFDMADYQLRSDKLVIRLDGVAGDGSAGENDNVLANIEEVLGGSGDDFIEALSPASRTIHGNDGNDTIISAGGAIFGDRGSNRLTAEPAGIPTMMYGGEGNDTITSHGHLGDSLYGADGDDVLVGGDGNDTLQGGEGNNNLDGGGGNDTLSAGEGHDVFAGGAGHDLVTYWGHWQDLSLTLDGIANDGAADEADDIHSGVEDITGGSGNDLIAGNDADNIISGGQGNDTIRGGGGNDSLFGDAIRCDGDRRSRRVCMMAELTTADQLFGEAGNDTINGIRGADSLYGGAGDDMLLAFGTPIDAANQTLDGGDGTDEAHVDAGLDIVSNVEKVFDASGQSIP